MGLPLPAAAAASLEQSSGSLRGLRAAAPQPASLTARGWKTDLQWTQDQGSCIHTDHLPPWLTCCQTKCNLTTFNPINFNGTYISPPAFTSVSFFFLPRLPALTTHLCAEELQLAEPWNCTGSTPGTQPRALGSPRRGPGTSSDTQHFFPWLPPPNCYLEPSTKHWELGSSAATFRQKY